MTVTEVPSAPAPAARIPAMADLGLLVLRLVFGLVLAGHGSQKLFGWFDGAGLAGTGKFFASLGYRPGQLFAFVAGLSEVTGGLLLAAGLLVPLASAIVLGVMVNAIAATWPGGLLTPQGWELPLLYATAAVTLAATGPGRYALDTGRAWQRRGPLWAVASVGLGLGVGLATLVVKLVVK